MMDTYTYCESKRISPEAPVPIVIPKDVINIPGGAGNVAMNLSKLGAQVTCVGCVGGDHLGLDLINYFITTINYIIFSFNFRIGYSL